MVAGSAFGFAADPRVESGDGEAGNCAEKEGLTPAPERAEFPAGKIAESCAYGNGQIENRQDAVAIALGIEVGEDGWGEDAEGCFAYSYQSVADEEGAVVVDPGCAESGYAPQHCAGDDEGLAAEMVA